MLQFFGIASGIVWSFGLIPYIRDIFRHTTKPERAAWFIWSVLGFIAFFSQLAEGATWSLWLTASNILGVFIVFVLSVKYGVGGLRRRDIISLIVAAIGLYLWYITRHAYIALYISMFIDIIGYVLIFPKVYKDHKSETLSAWLLFSISGLVAALSVGKFDLILLSYPLYIFTANFAVVVVILLGRARMSKSK